MNSQFLMERFLDIDCEIEDRFLKKTAFKDKNLEKKFQNENYINEYKEYSVSNMIVILGYFATFIYIFFAFFRIIFIICCICCFFLTLISIYISMRSNQIKFKLLNDHIQIFLSSFNLWFKAIIICVFYNTPENDNIEELLRVIIYDFVSTNIFIIVKIEADYRINLFYFFQSLVIIIFSQIYSNKNHYFFLEIVTSFFMYLIFFSLRKEWDYKLRRIFAQKYKFERTYEYIQEYLVGLNGYSFNIKNANNFYVNEKMDKLINEISAKKLTDSDLFFKKIKYKCKYNLEKENKGIEKNDKYLAFNFLRQGNIAEVQSRENQKLFEFFDKLILFENNDCYIGLSNQVNSENKVISEKSPTLLDFIIEEYCENKIYLRKNVPISKDTSKIEDFLQELKCFLSKKKDFNNYSEKKPISNKQIGLLKLIESKIEINFDKSFDDTENRSIINYKNQINSSENFVNFSHTEKNENFNENFVDSNCIFKKNNLETSEMNGKDKPISYEYLNNLNNHFKRNIDKLENFVSIGKFYYKNEENCKKYYFDVLHRSMKIGSKNLLEDYFIYDITELINDKRIIEENIKKQKIFAKISHEFKTPLNSIISLIDSLENPGDLENVDTIKNFKIIKNLSNYLVFLIADIVQYSQITEIQQIKIIKKDIDLKSLINFCFDILKTLIHCNKSKRLNVITNCYFEDEIDKIKIEADETRLKQVILNFISNSVKFTREGLISIECKLKYSNKGNFIKIIVKDTGIGIRDDEKEFIGKDFSLINTNLNFINNQIGSGLGLSICKSLIELMGFKFQFKSKFSEGSKFSILIPHSSDSMIEEVNFPSVSLRKNLSDRLKDNKLKCKSLFANNKQNGGSIDLFNNDDIQDKLDRSFIAKRSSQKYLFKDIKSSINTTERNTRIRIISPNRKLKNPDSISIMTGGKLKKGLTYNLEEEEMAKFSMLNSKRLECFQTQRLKPIIIIADDNEIIQNSNKRILLQILKERELNYEVVVLDDGLDIIKFLLNFDEKHEFIKLIITDENMEYFNGSDAIRFIRKYEDTKNLTKIPIYSLTCHENKEITDRIINSGADYILFKPLSKNGLQDFLEKHLR